ncbi:MAG: hypothetical protein JSW01_05470 [Candidatus Bathyarchaeota archaeon]|nr:MAG: hypothetical protein JSW01_05470 [Candidatus Bathyarchaeota archaeon]
MGENREQRVDESKALFFSMLIAVLLAVSIVLLKVFYGPLLDPVFEFLIYYLPATLLTTMYVLGKIKER